MSLFFHLRALKKTILWIICGQLVFTLIAYYLYPSILTFLLNKIPNTLPVWTTTLFEGFWVRLNLALSFGFLFNIPLLLGALFHFVSPGLYPREKWVLRFTVIVSSIFGLLGAVFSYCVVIPIVFKFLTLENLKLLPYHIQMVAYLSPTLLFILHFFILLALYWQLPLIIFLILYSRLISRKMLLRKANVLIMILSILTAFFTPDGYSLLLMFILTFGLIYGSLGVAFLFKIGGKHAD